MPCPCPRAAALMLLALALRLGLGSGGGPRPAAGPSLAEAPACMADCVAHGRGCRACMRAVSETMLCTPARLELPFHRAHPTVPAPVLRTAHHDFLDRPPHATRGAVPAGFEVAGKTHADCPAMLAMGGRFIKCRPPSARAQRYTRS
jgi:hypothetical protein